MIDMLKQYPAKCIKFDFDNKNLLHLAADLARENVVLYLLQTYPELAVDCKTKYDCQNLLHIAVSQSKKNLAWVAIAR